MNHFDYTDAEESIERFRARLRKIICCIFGHKMIEKMFPNRCDRCGITVHS